MLTGKFRSKLFSAISRNCDQLKIKNFSAKLKQFCSLSPLRCSSSTIHAFSCYLRTNVYTFTRSFKFTRLHVKFCQYSYCNANTKKLVNTIFKRLPPGRPICTFAAAAYSFSWEDNHVTNVEIQT